MAQMQGGGPKPYLKDDTARADNAADGLFAAQPFGTRCLFSAPYRVASPRCIVLEYLHRRSSWSGTKMPGVGAPPLFVRGSY